MKGRATAGALKAAESGIGRWSERRKKNFPGARLPLFFFCGKNGSGQKLKNPDILKDSGVS